MESVYTLGKDCRTMKIKYVEKKKGFTLIELLVVIAIIGLLLSIIVPVLGKAKMYAQEVICATNLHQYHIATELFTTENKDVYPHPWRSLYKEYQFSGEVQRYCRWHNPDYSLESHPEYAGPFWPYLASTKASICPTFNAVAQKYGEFHPYHNAANNRIEVQFSYSMNGMLAFRQTGTTGVGKAQVGSSPSQTFLWAEENMWLLKTQAGAKLSNEVLNDSALLPGQPDSPVDCIGSFHKIAQTKLSLQQSTGVYDSGVANVLFLDGSLAYASPLDTYRYAGKLR